MSLFPIPSGADPIFRDFSIWGVIFRFCRFFKFYDFANLGVYSSFNEKLLEQLKTCLVGLQITILEQLIMNDNYNFGDNNKTRLKMVQSFLFDSNSMILINAK